MHNYKVKIIDGTIERIALQKTGRVLYGQRRRVLYVQPSKQSTCKILCSDWHQICTEEVSFNHNIKSWSWHSWSILDRIMKMTSQRHARCLSNDLDDDVTLVFRKPSWQLRASLASVLITPVLYQLYLIMVTIRYILFLQTFSCKSVKHTHQ